MGHVYTPKNEKNEELKLEVELIKEKIEDLILLIKNNKIKKNRIIHNLNDNNAELVYLRGILKIKKESLF